MHTHLSVCCSEEKKCGGFFEQSATEMFFLTFMRDDIVAPHVT